MSKSNKEDPLEYFSVAFYGGASDRLAAAMFDRVNQFLRPLLPGQLQGPWGEGGVAFDVSDEPDKLWHVSLTAGAVDAAASIPAAKQAALNYILGCDLNPKRKFDAMLDYWVVGWWSASNAMRTSGLSFSIRTSLLANHVLAANNSEPAMTRAVHEILDYLIETWEPHYGLVDVSHWQHAGAGVAYEVNPVQTPWSHLQQQAETAVWNADEERQRDHVRGIYWGQLLNPRHLAKLGGIDAVRCDLEKMGKGYYLTPKAKGYAFLQLGPGPMNSSVFGVRIPYFDAAVWYRRRIVEAGLLM